MAIASVEVREEFEGQGESRKLVGYTRKVKFWDKPSAINMVMRHLGLFEKDNAQVQDNLRVEVVLLQPKTSRAG